MGFNSHALYQYLLEDLASGVPGFETGEPWPGITPRQFAGQALANSFYKKFIDEVADDADTRAFEKFLAVNSDCRDWELTCSGSWDEVLVGELKQQLYDFFYPGGYCLFTNHHQILDEGKTGPGSARGARGTDFYTKLFDSPLTTTSSKLEFLFQDYVSTDPEWSTAENNRCLLHGDGHLVEGSQFSFAPKTDDISRMIAVEPNLNMFFQLGVGRIIEKRLDRFYGLNLSTQPDKNRELARVGSIDGSFGTIDLSSASDSLGLKMLREVLPPEVLRWLCMFRSPTGRYNDELVQLEMISTMGNGFTFPLETCLFAAVVFAAARVSGVKLDKPNGNRLGSFAVFGDDIIVGTSMVPSVLRLLKLLGFKTNPQKTFVEGPFRESCGNDWFLGHNVRGIYLKSLSSRQDRYVAINNLNLWSARVGIPLQRTIGYILAHVRFRPVPPWENLDAGIRVPLFMAGKLKTRQGMYLYDTYNPVAPKLKLEERSIYVPEGFKVRHYNPSGLIKAILGGYIIGKGEHATISLRSRSTLYRSKLASAPSWDHLPLGSDIVLGLSPGFYDYAKYPRSVLEARQRTMSENAWGRWKTVTYLNLFR